MTHIKNASSGYTYREVTALDALGNITASAIGNGIMTQVQDFHPATGQMLQNKVTQTSGSTVHELEYDYDGFSNLYQSQVTASNNLQNYETFSYDNLHRLTSSDRAYSSTSRPNDAINYAYSNLGNITSKNDYFSTAVTAMPPRAQAAMPARMRYVRSPTWAVAARITTTTTTEICGAVTVAQ